MDLPAEVYDGLRANDFLVSLSKWDGRNLVVTGGSQGGALTITTAGLDPRVTALALETGHFTVPEQTERVDRWIEARTGVQSLGAK